ncbi:MAG: DUF222 domain-containing protein [Gordonia sp. (in: high G+C Gram-positive bacteria)]
MTPTAPAPLPSAAAELVSLIDAATEALEEASLTAETPAELIEVARSAETARRKLDAVNAKLICEISDRGAAETAGYANLNAFLRQGLRLSRGEAFRRRTVATETGRRYSLQGEPLPPRRQACAGALADGTISGAHVEAIVKILTKIPAAVPADTIEKAEHTLVEASRVFAPDELPALGQRILAHLDPDGHLTDENDRQRQRGFTLGPQDQQLMSTLRGACTPEIRGMLEVILTVWAAPGSNNPDDPDSPSAAACGFDADNTDPVALEAAAARDHRTQPQRNHDALLAMCRYVLAHHGLGAPDRIPTELVITTTLTELEQRAGTALTATGTHLPVTDVIALAAETSPWLEVFADRSAAILHFGRGRRLATKTQRLALFGRDRGCTMPGCDRPAAHSQAHHMPAWKDGGRTDIDALGNACGLHNRREGHHPGQWESTILTTGPHTGRVAWRPAGSNQPWQVNPLHHAELMLQPPTVDGEVTDLPDDRVGGDEGTATPAEADSPTTSDNGPARTRRMNLRIHRPKHSAVEQYLCAHNSRHRYVAGPYGPLHQRE